MAKGAFSYLRQSRWWKSFEFASGEWGNALPLFGTDGQIRQNRWGLSGIAPDRARPPFFGVPQSPAVHAAGRFHWGRKCRTLFLLRQLKRLLVVFKGMFSFDLFVQAVVFPFVSFENTFRSLGRFLPVFCLYVYLLAAAFLWEWSGLAPESFIWLLFFWAIIPWTGSPCWPSGQAWWFGLCSCGCRKGAAFLAPWAETEGFGWKLVRVGNFCFCDITAISPLVFPWLCQKIFKRNIVIIRAAGHGGSPWEKEYGFLLRGEITSWSWVLQESNLYLSLNGLLFPLSDWPIGPHNAHCQSISLCGLFSCLGFRPGARGGIYTRRSQFPVVSLIPPLRHGIG